MTFSIVTQTSAFIHPFCWLCTSTSQQRNTRGPDRLRFPSLDSIVYVVHLHRRWGVPDFCQLVLIGSPLLMEHGAPDSWKFLALRHALRDAIDWINLNPKEAKGMWLERFPPKDEVEAGLWELCERTRDVDCGFFFRCQRLRIIYIVDVSGTTGRRGGAWRTRHDDIT